MILIFINDQGKSISRQLIIPERSIRSLMEGFNRQDRFAINIYLQSMILNEGKVTPKKGAFFCPN
jgi:hypothetical protein